ncbi:MAG: hypothetical protein A3G83_12460 [Betaproteobacteria bacterium RIFCSPLOWO2_12_FULL_68_20]|nr:MAG: hypothetical protein A3G83_12460 [Betaproteobacteria bacterium RIFCSPLOWO2_12_FULL_68_20]
MTAKTQRGVALVALLALFVIGGAWYLVARLDAMSANFTAATRQHNAGVLNQAKQALIGYVAQQAATAGENNPGRLPCPEAPGDYGTVNEGRAAGNCTLPAVGRLPWRTLGIDKQVDAASEPLWYVVSGGWALSNGTVPPLTTFINSNSQGQLTVDLAPNDSVALIIAPGPPISVQAATGCTAWSQARSAVGPPVLRNYLECENATSPADAVFVTTGPSGSFNDQAVRVTTRDLMPAIEGAIAHRIEREVVPLLKSIYATSTWGANVSAANPVYPFPAPFANPANTASFLGSAVSCAGGACQGLLPLTFSFTAGTTTRCTPGAGSLCDPAFVVWQTVTVTRISGATLTPDPTTCALAADGATCTLNITTPLLGGETIDVRIDATERNVAMAMRQFNSAVAISGWTLLSGPTVTMNADGSATVTATGRVTTGAGGPGPPGGGPPPIVGDLLCGLPPPIFNCREYTVTVPDTFFPDHAFLNNTADPTYGWFWRNEWYRLLYYATAQGNTASALPGTPACTTGGTCLTVTNFTPANDKRSILLLAGRSLTGMARPNDTFTDFLDSAENRNLDAVFDKLPAGSSSNDRVVVVDANP